MSHRKDTPKCSIVTINYNNICGLYDTLKSIAALRAADIQVIVIDGWSSDQSQKALEDYDWLIDVGISEKDSGIYDAMNKGVAHARGDYVVFMNSGDSFHNPDVLGLIPFSDGHDIFYGKAYSLQSGKEWKYNDALWKGMIFSHQSAFIKREWLERFPFSTGLKIAADYEFLVRCETNGATFKDTGLPVAMIDTSGVSFDSFEARTLERFRICQEHYRRPDVFAYYRNLLESRDLPVPDEFFAGFGISREAK